MATLIIKGTKGNDLLTGLTGNASDDSFDGGLGADTMKGGLGNDTYYVDNPGDVVIEAAGEGSDTVISSITWTLGKNLENLTLDGKENINGTGNDLANILTGNDRNNRLDGGNDTVADIFKGGLGDDTYVIRQKIGRAHV